jgi:hypothetical protein
MIDVVLGLCGAFLFTFVVNFIAFGLLALLMSRGKTEKAEFGHILVLIMGMSLLGACAGFTGGLSRQAAVGAIVPALFGLLGGLVLYLFGVDRSRGAIASLLAGCLSVSLFLSYSVSAQIRNYDDELRDLRDHCISAYTDSDILSNSQALAAFETRFLPYCRSALDWNLDPYHHNKALGLQPAAK